MQNTYKIYQSYLPSSWRCGQVLAAKVGRRQFEIIDEPDSSGFVALRKLPPEERIKDEYLMGRLKAIPFHAEAQTNA